MPLFFIMKVYCHKANIIPLKLILEVFYKWNKKHQRAITFFIVKIKTSYNASDKIGYTQPNLRHFPNFTSIFNEQQHSFQV